MRNAVALGAHVSLIGTNQTMIVTTTMREGAVAGRPLAGGPEVELGPHVALSRQGGSRTLYEPGRLVTAKGDASVRMITGAFSFEEGPSLVSLATNTGFESRKADEVTILPNRKLIPGDLVDKGRNGAHEIRVIERIGNLHFDGSDAALLDDGTLACEINLVLVSGHLESRLRVPRPHETCDHVSLGACQVLEVALQEEGPLVATVAHAGGITQVAFDEISRKADAIASEAQDLEDELDEIAIARYREEWGPGPFETADCVAFWRDEVLLIKRRNRPQKGRWATPGGFLNKDEPAYMSAIRELVEETLFRLTGKHAGKDLLELLAAAVVGTFEQKGPTRDPRAHIDTTVTVLDLDLIDGLERPEVKADDDAEDAQWTKLAEVPRGMYADHRDIVATAAKFAGRSLS